MITKQEHDFIYEIKQLINNNNYTKDEIYDIVGDIDAGYGYCLSIVIKLAMENKI